MTMNGFLRQNEDQKYKDFMQKQIFTNYEIIGVRMPILKEKAKEIIKAKNLDEYLETKDFKSYDEIQLYGCVLNLLDDFSLCLNKVDFVLNHIDNWSNCDNIRPKIFAKNPELLKSKINEWLKSKNDYKIRFAILCMIRYFPNDDKKLLKVLKLESKKRYINMVRAWYIAECFANDFDKTLAFLEEHKLDNKTVTMLLEKCKNSDKISKEKKKVFSNLRCRIKK